MKRTELKRKLVKMGIPVKAGMVKKSDIKKVLANESKPWTITISSSGGNEAWDLRKYLIRDVLAELPDCKSTGERDSDGEDHWAVYTCTSYSQKEIEDAFQKIAKEEPEITFGVNEDGDNTAWIDQGIGAYNEGDLNP